MDQSPGTLLREAVLDLDASSPGAWFKIQATHRVADIIDLWWEELRLANEADDPEVQSQIIGSACMTMARAIGASLTGTLAYFGDRESVSNTVTALALIIAGCERYLDHDVLPTRDIVDEARSIEYPVVH